MYRVIQSSGDDVPVPRLVFARLSDYDADDARFRVVLYLLAGGEGEAQQLAEKLHMRQDKVQHALAYWEGAGLLEQVEPLRDSETATLLTKRRRLNAREVVAAGQSNPTLGMLLQELQRVFGGVVSENDGCLFATLYMEDEFQADLILMAASYCAAMGKVNARYIEKVLISWRREGICNCETADRYLQLLGQREEREKEVADMFGLSQPAFSLSERRRIAEWFEDFAYSADVIQAARLAAGDKKDEVKYLGAILKKWHAKGYKTLRDVQQSDQNRNLRVEGSRSVLPQKDILMQQGGYVQMKRQEKKL